MRSCLPIFRTIPFPTTGDPHSKPGELFTISPQPTEPWPISTR